MVCPPFCGVGRACAVPCFCSQYLVFASSSSEMAVGTFEPFGLEFCSNSACTQLFLVPYNFFVFCSWKRGVSRCKLCSIAAKDPRSQCCLNFLIMSTETDVSGLFYFFIQVGMEHTKHTILYFVFFCLTNIVELFGTIGNNHRILGLPR